MHWLGLGLSAGLCHLGKKQGRNKNLPYGQYGIAVNNGRTKNQCGTGNQCCPLFFPYGRNLQECPCDKKGRKEPQFPWSRGNPYGMGQARRRCHG